MSKTVFKCSRCGYESSAFSQFKTHLQRKRECQPNQSDIPLKDIKQQYQEMIEKHSEKKRRRTFGQENLDYIEKTHLIEYVGDPLSGIQEIIQEIYFNKGREENHTVRMINGDTSCVEIYTEDGWMKANQKKVFSKMIYRASDIMEYNIPKKHWNSEFKHFIEGMGELDNEELLVLILEEVENTVLNAEKEYNKIH